MSDSADDDVRRLVEAAQNGDDEALDDLVRRHLPALRAFCRLESRALRDKEECSDIVQTACRQALQNLDGYQWQGPGSFKNWLFSFAMQKINNRRQFWGAAKRRSDREVKQGFDELGHAYATMSTPSRLAMGREEIARIEALLDQLPDDYREVIVLARIMGLGHRDIAARLDRSEGAVRVLLSRALARLATLMDNRDA